MDNEAVAVDVINHVGPRGHFLMEEHTLTLVRNGELIGTKIFDRDRRDACEMKGSQGLAQKAREKAIGIFDEHKVPSLPDAVLRELDAIVRAADIRCRLQIWPRSVAAAR